MREGTSSDESDDSMVLPTPNAKSTPLPRVAVKREATSSEDSSSDEDTEIKKQSTTNGHSSPSEDSSSDESEDCATTVTQPQVMVKRGGSSSSHTSSSDEETKAYSTPARSVRHRKSGAGSENETHRVVSNGFKREPETSSSSASSNDESEDKPNNSSHVQLKVKPSSNDSDEETAPAPQQTSSENDSIDDEDEPKSNNSNPVRLKPKPASSSSDGDSEIASASQQTTSEDDSTDDENEPKSNSSNSVRLKAKPASSSSDSDEETAPTPQRASSENESTDESDDESSKIKTPTPIKRELTSDRGEIDFTRDGQRQVPGVSFQKNYLNSSLTSDVTANQPSSRGRHYHSVSESDSESEQEIPNTRITPTKCGAELMQLMFQGKREMDTSNASLTVEDITDDDDIWLIQCPRMMDVKSLKKQNINVGGEGTIQLETGPSVKRFSVVSEPDTAHSIHCILPSKTSGSFKMVTLPVQGKIFIEEHIHIPKLKVPDVNYNGPVPFPGNLKVRHPLLGSSYQDHIAAATTLLRRNIISKRRRKEKISIVNNLEPAEGPLISSVKRKRKHSRSVEEAAIDVVDGTEEASVTEKKKRRKHQSDSYLDLTMMNDSNVDGTEEASVTEKKKRRKHQSDSYLDSTMMNDSNVDGTEEASVTEKKERRKHKSDSYLDSAVMNVSKREISHNESSAKLKHKLGNSVKAADPDTCDESDIPYILPGKKHKKSRKDKKESIISTDNYYSDFSQENLTTPSKEKRQKKSKSQDQDILSPENIKREPTDFVMADKPNLWNESQLLGKKRKESRESNGFTNYLASDMKMEVDEMSSSKVKRK